MRDRILQTGLFDWHERLGKLDKDGHITVNTKHFDQKLFEIWPFVLAVTIGDMEGRILPIVITEDVY